MTSAKETRFCLRTDLIHPVTCKSDPVSAVSRMDLIVKGEFAEEATRAEGDGRKVEVEKGLGTRKGVCMIEQGLDTFNCPGVKKDDKGGRAFEAEGGLIEAKG